MPLRGVVGSDLTKNRSDWQVAQNPFSESRDPLLFVAAIVPDVALFHARWGDEAGNVWVGRRRELATLAHAARNTYVTVEEVRRGDMLEDELLAPGVISGTYISSFSEAPQGAWPLGIADVYGIDDAHLAQYAKAAKTREGFERYLEEFVWQRRKSSSPASSPA
jgi:glutaconate CoA-transferase subunit A